MISMCPEKYLYYLLICFSLDELNRWRIVSVARNENTEIIIIVRS